MSKINHNENVNQKQNQSSFDFDTEVSLIQSFIPIGLMAVRRTFI